MVEFRTNLTSFLRDTLSGAQEQQRLATNALIVPIGKRTNLAQARRQIDKSFDDVEKALHSFMMSNTKHEETKQKTIELKRKVPKAKSGSKSNLLGTGAGLLLGGALDLIQYAVSHYDQIVKSAKAFAFKTSEWIMAKLDDTRKAVGGAFTSLLTSAKGMFTEAREAAVQGVTDVGTKISDAVGASIDKVKEWGSGIVESVGRAFDVSSYKVPPPNPTLPQQSKVVAADAVDGFWSSMTKMLRDWLMSMFAPNASNSVSSDAGAGAGGAGGGFASFLQGQMGGGGQGGGAIPTDVANLPPTQAANTAEMMGYAMDQLRQEGVPEGNLRAAAAILVGQAHMESGLDPNKHHDNNTGYGIYGARLDRMTKMLAWQKERGFAPNSAEGQMRQMAHSAMTEYPVTRQHLMGATEGSIAGSSWVVTKDFENPKYINNRTGATIGAFAAGAPDKRPAILKQSQGPAASIGRAPEVSTPPTVNSPPSKTIGPVSMNEAPSTKPSTAITQVAEAPVPPAPTRQSSPSEITVASADTMSNRQPAVHMGGRPYPSLAPHARITNNLGLLFVGSENLG